MKINLIKIFVPVFVFFVSFAFGSQTVLAQEEHKLANGQGGTSTTADVCLNTPEDPACDSYFQKNCNNPLSRAYTTAKCAEIRLGLSEIETGTIIVPRDPNSLIVVFFRILLAIVIIITVGRIVIIGIQIAGLGDDADKRKELFVQIIYTLTGLVIALSALGITFLVQNIVFGRTFNDQVFQCSDLPTNASQELKDKCSQYLNITPAP